MEKLYSNFQKYILKMYCNTKLAMALHKVDESGF
jgi:hypothetical protein